MSCELCDRPDRVAQMPVVRVHSRGTSGNNSTVKSEIERDHLLQLSPVPRRRHRNPQSILQYIRLRWLRPLCRVQETLSDGVQWPEHSPDRVRMSAGAPVSVEDGNRKSYRVSAVRPIALRPSS